MHTCCMMAPTSCDAAGGAVAQSSRGSRRSASRACCMVITASNKSASLVVLRLYQYTHNSPCATHGDDGQFLRRRSATALDDIRFVPWLQMLCEPRQTYSRRSYPR